MAVAPPSPGWCVGFCFAINKFADNPNICAKHFFFLFLYFTLGSSGFLNALSGIRYPSPLVQSPAENAAVGSLPLVSEGVSEGSGCTIRGRRHQVSISRFIVKGTIDDTILEARLDPAAYRSLAASRPGGGAGGATGVPHRCEGEQWATPASRHNIRVLFFGFGSFRSHYSMAVSLFLIIGSLALRSAAVCAPRGRVSGQGHPRARAAPPAARWWMPGILPPANPRAQGPPGQLDPLCHPLL